MYKKFFGFKERPFQLVPNPAYLYLSKCHEEALAHLTYAISQGDGFVEIIGEVGTGKTTLCRVFLESLNDNTEVAYIFNPKLDSIQLLRAINDDFGIDSSPDSIKELIDILNRFLIEKKKEGKQIILLIDEAQNLSIEVLEQLRLLSNLETATSKLLQIILVGQPELGETLDSYELRQLGQRITLSCQLLPLTIIETLEYIRHRLYVASGRPTTKFSYPAIREVYKFSHGIPRLINIVCDRSLLTAYVLGKTKITRSIVRKAIREMTVRTWENRWKAWVPALCGAVFILLMIMVFHSRKQAIPVNPATGDTAVEKGVAGADAEAAAPEVRYKISPQGESAELTEEKEIPADKQVLAAQEHTRRAALQTALQLWDEKLTVSDKLDSVNDDASFFNIGAKMNGFSIYQLKDEFAMVFAMDLPAIIQIYMPGYDDPLYLVVVKINGEKIYLDQGNGKILTLSRIELDQQWTGVAYVPWKNYLNFVGTIPGTGADDSVLTLKMLLRDLGHDNLALNSTYDKPAEAIVRAIQRKHGLKPDGIVDDLTKILIYSEKKSFNMPTLSPGESLEKTLAKKTSTHLEARQ